MHVSCTWARADNHNCGQPGVAARARGTGSSSCSTRCRKGSMTTVNRVDRYVDASPHEAVALLCAAQQLSALTFVSLCWAGFLLCCLCLQTTGPAAPANMRGNVHPGATWTNTHTSPLLATMPSRCAGHGSCPAAAHHRLCRTAAAHLIVVPAVIAAQACHRPAHHAVVQDACTVQGLAGVQQPSPSLISCALTLLHH
jgi:hypothetical protein